MMNPHDAIQHLAKQAEFCGKRALESTSEATILAYSTRADIYYTLATTLSILFSSPAALRDTNFGLLGDADDKAKDLSEPRGDLRNTEGPWSGGFADNH